MANAAAFYVYTCPQCDTREVLPRGEALDEEGAPLPLRCYAHEDLAPRMEGPEQISLPLEHAQSFQRLRRARQETMQAEARFRRAMEDLAEGDAGAAQALAGEGRRYAVGAAEGAGDVCAQTLRPTKIRRTPVE